MIQATFSQSISGSWDRAVNTALARWSEHLIGEALLRIEMKSSLATPFLSYAGPVSWRAVGELDGSFISIPGAALDILTGTDHNPQGVDISITVNPSFNWYFGLPGNTPESAYSAVSTMMHELGHGLFMISTKASDTPFEVWARNKTSLFDGSHFISQNHLMSADAYEGAGKSITELDIIVAGKSGLATIYDDMIYLPSTTKIIDAGPGNDVGIWLGSFDAFGGNVINFETIEMRGPSPLTQSQQDIYKLYDAALGRAPDLDGFTYWVNSPASYVAISESFAASDEFNVQFSTRSELLYVLYDNALDRAPDADGFDYWIGRNDLSNAQLLREFALAQENVIPLVWFDL